MMKRLLFLTLITAFAFSSHAQYTTPNTGITWNLTELVANAPQIISYSDGIYTLSQNLTIASTDSFVINENATIKIDPDVQIFVEGNFTADANEVLITATNITAPYNTIRFEENSSGFIRNTTIDYGKGIRVATGNFEMQNSSMSYHVSGTTGSGTLNFSAGKPIINNSRFTFNAVPAFSSGANQVAAPVFTNNYLEGNNTANANRPQINMSATGNDTIKIIGNIIKGNRELILTGGISVTSFFGDPIKVLIENNTITDNRYGITIGGGNAVGYIRGNLIEDNNTQNLPNLGGSGISINATGTNTMNLIASQNQIRRNLWGITMIGTAKINLGNDNPELGDLNGGGNVFSENQNTGQTYALFNNTALPILAMNNCWTEGVSPTAQSVENVISHQVDNPALGLVTFMPFSDCLLGTTAFENRKISFYPNPNSGLISIEMNENGDAEIFNLSGQMLSKFELKSGTNRIAFEFPQGIYLMKTTTASGQFTDKVIRQ